MIRIQILEVLYLKLQVDVGNRANSSSTYTGGSVGFSKVSWEDVFTKVQIFP